MEVARLLGRQPVALDPARRHQQVGVMVGAFAIPIALMGRVYVELHRETARHEVPLGEAAHQLQPVLMREVAVGGERDYQLACHLGVLAPLGRFGGVPQRGGVAQFWVGPFGQQHLVVLGRVAVREGVERPGALLGDRFAGVVGRRAHCRAAGRAGQVASTGESDGHAEQFDPSQGPPASRIQGECILRLHVRPSLRSEECRTRLRR